MSKLLLTCMSWASDSRIYLFPGFSGRLLCKYVFIAKKWNNIASKGNVTSLYPDSSESKVFGIKSKPPKCSVFSSVPGLDSVLQLHTVHRGVFFICFCTVREAQMNVIRTEFERCRVEIIFEDFFSLSFSTPCDVSLPRVNRLSPIRRHFSLLYSHTPVRLLIIH